MSRTLAIIAGLSGLLVLAGCRGRSQPTPTAGTGAPAETPAPGRIQPAIRLSAGEVRAGQNVTVDYQLANGGAEPLTVLRIETNTGTIAPGRPGWRQSAVPAGRTALISSASLPAGTPGTRLLSATFVTDRGSFDAVPVRLTITGQPGATGAGRVLVRLAVTPNPAPPGTPVTVSYEVADSAGPGLLVTSIDIDSAQPLLSDNPAWLTNRVPPGARAIVARRTLVKSEPGSYTLRARFDTDKGRFDAPPVTLVIAAPESDRDTGHVLAQIRIAPNPCPMNTPYTIEYRVINTTRTAVAVTRINTDIGPIVPGDARWQTGEAGAGRTTTIARITGTGGAVSSRTKTAAFETGAGRLDAAPVVFVVQ